MPIGVLRMGKQRYLIGLAAIVVLGAILRFHDIAHAEVTEPNAAGYMVITRGMVLIADWTWDNAGRVVAGNYDPREIRDLFRAEGVRYEMPYYAKPFYDLQNIIAYKLSGGNYWSLIWLTAFWSTLVIPVVAGIAWYLWGPATGLWAALLFAVSGSAIGYARDGLAHSASLLFFALGLLLFFRSLRTVYSDVYRLIACVGVLWGMALTSHPNTLPLVCICLAFAAFRGVLRREYLDGVVRAGLICVGIASIALLFELAYIAVYHYLGDVFLIMQNQTRWSTMTYFGQINSHFGLVMTGPLSLVEKIYTYIFVFWAFEGIWVWAAIALASIVCLFNLCVNRSFEREELLPVALFWIPLLFFILSNNTADYRYIAGLLIPAVLLGGKGVAWIVERAVEKVERVKPLVVVGAVLVVVSHVWYLQPLYSAQSAWKETALWLQQRGAKQVISLVSDFNWVINDIEPIRAKEGFTHIEGSYIALYRRYPQVENERILSLFEKGIEPEFTAGHRRPIKMMEVQLANCSPLIEVLAHVPYVKSQIALMRHLVVEREQLRRIEVYDLRKLVSRVPVGDSEFAEGKSNG